MLNRKSCFLRSDGQILDPDGLSEDISLGPSIVSPKAYYIVVKHRNHLSIMSADAMELNGLTTYDFTDAQSRAYTLEF